MRGLRAIGAIFAAAAGLDAEQTTALHLFATPMREMRSPALRNQIEERLMIKRRELIKCHLVAAMLSRKSRIENRKLIDPLIGLRNEDGQLFHHVLSLSDRAN